MQTVFKYHMCVVGDTASNICISIFYPHKVHRDQIGMYRKWPIYEDPVKATGVGHAKAIPCFGPPVHGRPSSGPEKRAIIYPSVRDQPRQLSKLDIGSWADFLHREKNNAGDMMLLVRCPR